MFVGISDKEGMEPFDKKTDSGRIIHSISEQLNCVSYFLNYVSYPPKDSQGKLRYPNHQELLASFPSFQERVLEIQPDLIVVCGNMIFQELKRHSFYQETILKIYHPSYVWIYRRSTLNEYIISVVEQIKRMIS